MASTDTGSTGTGTSTPRIPQARDSGEHEVRSRPTGWLGWIVFAGCMMLMVGMFQAIWGIVALVDPGYYAVGPNGMVLDINYNSWGWGHLILGVVVAVIGGAVVMGRAWARPAAMVVAILSAMANFLSLGIYPIWSIIMITVNVFVIYALAVHGDEMSTLQE
jgi:hypothetical protein